MMAISSCRHNMHLFVMLVYAGVLVLIDRTYPTDLNIAKVSAICKSGDKEDINNYRPISVISTLACVFERLIYNQIYDYLTVNNLLNPKQYGFRSLHSTALALSESTNHWLLDMGNGKMKCDFS